MVNVVLIEKALGAYECPFMVQTNVPDVVPLPCAVTVTTAGPPPVGMVAVDWPVR